MQSGPECSKKESYCQHHCYGCCNESDPLFFPAGFGNCFAHGHFAAYANSIAHWAEKRKLLRHRQCARLQEHRATTVCRQPVSPGQKRVLRHQEGTASPRKVAAQSKHVKWATS